MRRFVLVGSVLPAMLLLSGCSGLGKFFEDTATLPGQNPNQTGGISENVRRARGELPAEVPIVPEAGNVWPGPPQPLPTLADVAQRGGLGTFGNNGAAGGGANPLGGSAALRSGQSMSLGEQNAISGGVPVSNDFSGGGVLEDHVPDVASKYRTKDKGSDIVIPNGDGTNTVISPDGSVKTVPAAPK
jgi:hypothetical protein